MLLRIAQSVGIGFAATAVSTSLQASIAGIVPTPTAFLVAWALLSIVVYVLFRK